MELVLRKGILREHTVAPSPPREDCRIRATNDVEAMERWLDEYFDKPTTYKTYKKEAERFLIWCMYVAHKELRMLDRTNVEDYIEFVRNPTPRETWCGPRRKKSGEWFPFTGPLSDSAIITMLASLNSMMSYLVDARYVEFNPFALVRRKSRFKKKIDERAVLIHERILDEEEWQALRSAIEESDESTTLASFKKNRLRFLVSSLFFLGLRIDELQRARFSDCHKINGKWWFFVRGKGDRLGKIPINGQFLHEIMTYRHSLGRTPIPCGDEPLIHGLDNNDPLSVRQMSNLIKELAHRASQKFSATSPSHQKLTRFSPHWLRHLSASRQDKAGIAFTNIRENLRHQNDDTTRMYVHAYDEDRHRDMDKLTW